MLAGCVIGAAVFRFTRPVAAILLGWDAAAAIYLLWVWDAVRRLDAAQTGRLAAREALTGAATDITTKPIRRIALRHALSYLFGAAYLFGAVILAMAINVVASLLS